MGGLGYIYSPVLDACVPEQALVHHGMISWACQYNPAFNPIPREAQHPKSFDAALVVHSRKQIRNVMFAVSRLGLRA